MMTCSNEEKHVKAKDLKVIVEYLSDDSAEGILRSKQAKAIICDMILLAKKRGRPALQEDIENEAA